MKVTTSIPDPELPGWLRSAVSSLVLAFAVLGGCSAPPSEARILVADPVAEQVVAYDEVGTDLGVWLDVSDLPGDPHRFTPAALHHTGDTVWVAQDGFPSVFAADDQGWVGPIFDGSASTVRVEEPCAFTEVDGEPWLLANDTRTAVRLDAEGQVTGSLGDEVRSPHGIAELDGSLYVVSSLTTRDHGTLRVFTLDGTPGAHLTEAPLLIPTSVVAHEGTLLVADFGMDRVVRLDGDGQLVEVVLETRRPVSLALDPDGALLVAGDDGLQRVDLSVLGAPTELAGPGAFEMARNLLVIPGR